MPAANQNGGVNTNASQEHDSVELDHIFFGPSESKIVQLDTTQMQDLITSLQANNFKAGTLEDSDFYGLTDLVAQIHRTPLSENITSRQSVFSRQDILPLFIDENDNNALCLGVRVCRQGSSLVRDAHNVVYAIEELQMYFGDNGKNHTKNLKLIALKPEDYDRIDKNFLISNASQRSEFLNLYDDKDAGAHIRDVIVGKAIGGDASDIHIEPIPDENDQPSYRVRYRVRGDLIEEPRLLSIRQGISLISAIKILSNMDIAEHRRPGDGQMKYTGNELKDYPHFEGYTFRVSTVAAKDGETCVVRLHKPSRAENLKLSKLNFPKKIHDQTLELIRSPQGIILVTGPTGSGKSTTLYTCLSEINTPDTKIFTIEDPVEMNIKGLTQTEVNDDIGLDFKSLLRTALRQNPNVILIGEIRDAETASTAISAADTGHLVFATLHTNSSISAFKRLTDLGVQGPRFSESVKGIYAQRLVRTCCNDCAKVIDGASKINELLGLNEKDDKYKPFKTPIPLKEATVNEHAKGCKCCSGTGYAGRQVIVELWRPGTEEIDLISNGESREAAYVEAALKSGYRPMSVHGMKAVFEQKTTIDEVLKKISTRSELLKFKPYIYQMAAEAAKRHLEKNPK